MRKMFNRMKVALPLLALAALPIAAQEASHGYNAVEVSAALYEGAPTARVRVLNDVGVEGKGVRVAVQGLTEGDANGDYFFMREGITVNKAGSKNLGMVTATATQDGFLGVKAGYQRNLEGVLGGFGTIDVTVNHEEATSWLFYGRPISEKTTAEAFIAVDRPYEGKAVTYGEFGLHHAITKNLGAFVRYEMPDFSIENSTVVGGLRWTF